MIPTDGWAVIPGDWRCSRVWHKPKRCPEGLLQKIFDQLPDALTLRRMTVHIAQQGRRTRNRTLTTALVGPKACPAVELAGLYRQRWEAELDLRSLKTTLHMDVLRCLSPERVEKVSWAHLLVYNTVRLMMAHAATFTPHCWRPWPDRSYRIGPTRPPRATSRQTPPQAPPAAQRTPPRGFRGTEMRLIQVPFASGTVSPPGGQGCATFQRAARHGPPTGLYAVVSVLNTPCLAQGAGPIVRAVGVASKALR